MLLGIHPGKAFAGGPHPDPNLHLARISRRAYAIICDGNREPISSSTARTVMMPV